MEYLYLTAFLVLSVGILSTEGGECPNMPQKAIQACASKISVDLDTAEGHKFITDAEYSKKMCEGDDVNKALSCMETIYNDCTAAGWAEKDLIVKPGTWKEAMKELCDNRKFLTDNAACMQKGSDEMLKCVKDLTDKATADHSLEDINLATQTEKNHEKKFQIICSLSDNLMKCFDDTLIKNCPAKMKTILDEVLHKFLPPICHPGADSSYKTVKDDDKDNGAVKLSAVVAMSVTVVMCLRNML